MRGPTGRWLTFLIVGCSALYLNGCATTSRTAHVGKVVVVAGASSGFGKGVALELEQEGRAKREPAMTRGRRYA